MRTIVYMITVFWQKHLGKAKKKARKSGDLDFEVILTKCLQNVQSV